MTEKLFSIVHFFINPGESQAFKEKAQACMAAAKTDLTGTYAYEWFISPDESQAFVIEIYDGVAGLSHHGKIVGKTMPALLAHASLKIKFAGDMPADLFTQYTKRFPNAEHAGPRLQGKLQSPAPGAANPAPSGKIFAVARFSVHPGQEAAFRALAEDCFAHVANTEPATSGYEWFLNEAGTEALVLDIYDDAQALAAHMANAGPKMSKILPLVTSKVHMFGAVPGPFLAKFKPELGTTYGGALFQGIL